MVGTIKWGGVGVWCVCVCVCVGGGDVGKGKTFWLESTVLNLYVVQNRPCACNVGVMQAENLGGGGQCPWCPLVPTPMKKILVLEWLKQLASNSYSDEAVNFNLATIEYHYLRF